ncbi:MAG: NUDIX domain-containing protein [Saprospiraceae bacterium]
MDLLNKVKIVSQKVLYSGWSTLSEFWIDYRFENGQIIRLRREIYNSGDGAAILLYNEVDKKLLLVRQYRLAAVTNGDETGFLIECCAGMLDNSFPEKAIIKEVEEETGYRLQSVTKIGEVYATPGAHMEKIHLYVGRYDETMKISSGGGNMEEFEEIEIVQPTYDEVKLWLDNGAIKDAKTMILLQYGLIKGFIK